MNKKLICVAAVLSTVLALATSACSGSSKPTSSASSDKVAVTSSTKLDPNNPVELKFYSYTLSSASTAPGMQKLIDDFNNGAGKEAGVHVTGVADTGTQSKSTADIQAANQVDVIQEPFGSLSDAQTLLGIKAYNDIFPQSDLKSLTNGISANALELGKLNGKIYGIANTLSMPILYVNGSLFQSAGLDPTSAPKTWDDVISDAKTINQKTGKAGMAFGTDIGWDMEAAQSLIFSNGGQILSNDKTKAVFASQTAVTALSKLKQFYTDGSAALGKDTDLMQQFAMGKVGMSYMSSAITATYQKAANAGGWKLYGYPMPQVTSGKNAVPVNSGSCLVVRSESAQKSKAILTFLKYATGDEGYTTIASQIGYVPLRPYLLSDDKHLKSYAEKTPILQTAVGELSTMHSVTVWPSGTGTECMTVFQNAISKAVTTDVDMMQTLKDAQTKITKILQSNS